VVFELDDVIVLLPMSILTSWSGNVAIEPDPDRTARVVADLVLQGGVWDRPINLTEAVLGAESLAQASDDPMQDVALDLQLRGRGGIRVENNLGEFDITWGVLQVLGTAAQPVLRGDIRVTPGGRLNLPGRTVTVRRGQVRFTGNPLTDPILEIVPEEDILTVGGGSGESVDVTMLATRSLARGIGSALGLENETLRPAEIGVETETDSSSRFTVGQRLSRNVALFFSSDLGDVQDQTTMLQLWNLPGLRGLAVQGYTQTADDDNGVNLIQKFRWGGTSGFDDRPTIHKIHLEGSWPVSKRKLRKATGLRKGQPYEPFLLFAAGLRMERELAEFGFQNARVEARAEGDDRLPTLVFSVDPGDRQIVRFLGAQPPRRVRRDVVSLYQSPPLESSSLDLMAVTLRRHYAAEEYPDAIVEVGRKGELIEAIVDRGPKRRLEGPVVSGVDASIAAPIRLLMGTPEELDHLLDNPDRGRRVVERLLYIRGYHEASVARIWVEEVDQATHRVHLEVEPGRRTTLGDVEVRGEDPLGLMTRDLVALRPGMPLDRNEIDVAASRIRTEYIAAGYGDAEIRIRSEPRDDEVWDLTVTITPGAKSTVSEIDVRGLRHIREKVIRSGFRVTVGEELLPAELDSSVARVASFAPVRRVTATTSPLPGNQSRIELAVEEKARWTVEVGGGWSSERGTEARLGLRDDNLFGRGVGLNLRARWQQQEQLVFLYASLPPLPGRKLSLFGNIGFFDGDSREDPDFISERRTSAAIETTYAISSGTSARLYYRISESVFDLKEPDPILDPFFPVTEMEAILGTQLVRDRLDNPFDPRSGYYGALDVSWNSSELGSDLDDLRAVVTGSLALEPLDRWTWAQTLRFGWADGLKGQNLSVNRRFFAGGQASIRGFDTDSVGPSTYGLGGTMVPSGGGALFILNDEIRVPVWGGLRLAVFADVGQVWETWSAADFELAVGAGLGFRWSTPIGPVWGDVAWPVANRGISSGGPKFYLGIGRPF
jgi:outer membrane protein assembly factor BamA